jgi:hypothetical protein
LDLKDLEGNRIRIISTIRLYTHTESKSYLEYEDDLRS